MACHLPPAGVGTPSAFNFSAVFNGLSCVQRRDWASASDFSEAAAKFAREHGFLHNLAITTAQIAWALAHLGSVNDGIEMGRQGMTGCIETGMNITLPLGLAAQSESLLAGQVAIPYYPRHPITERLALTVFPQARPIRVGTPPAGVAVSILARSSHDSFIRPLTSGARELAGNEPAADAEDHGAQALAVAVEGVWPGADPGKHFRLVLAGTSKFATNEYFPYVSNGELGVAMLRWLAADETMPTLQPQTYSLSEIVLTSRQMRDVFIVLEVLLPLSTLLCGVLVWWRRR